MDCQKDFVKASILMRGFPNDLSGAEIDCFCNEKEDANGLFNSRLF